MKRKGSEPAIVVSTVSDEQCDVRETYEAQEQALSPVWDDPELDTYNNYDGGSAPP